MYQEDAPPSRQAPRFVPTLTEIVVPAGNAQTSIATDNPPWAPEPEPEPQSAGPLELLDSLKLLDSHANEQANDNMSELLARLGPELDVRLSEAIARVIHEQMPVLNARVRHAVAEVVRETVAGAFSHGG